MQTNIFSRAVHFENLPWKVQNMLHRFALANKLSSEIRVDPAVKEYDNFSSAALRVNFGSDRTMILKQAPLFEGTRLQNKTAPAFEREAIVYNTIFHKFKSVANQSKGAQFITVPVLHDLNLIQPYEYMLYEDLKQAGYQMNADKKVLSSEQASLVMTNLARFHAMSFYLKQYETFTYDKLIKQAETIHWEADPGRNGIHTFALKSLRENIRRHCSEHFDAESLERLGKFEYTDMVAPLNEGEGHHVLIHANPWVNNLMFKYDGTGEKPIDLSIIDWQIAFKAPPAADVTYVLYTALDQATRDAHYESLLDEYYRTLETTLDHLYCDASKLYPRAVFDEDVRTSAKFTLGSAIFSMHFMVATDPPTDDAYESYDNIGPLNYEFIELAQQNPAYKVRIADVVKDMVKRGIL